MTDKTAVQQRRRSRLPVLLLASLLLLVLAVAGYWRWFAAPPPEPPTVNLAEADPEVVEAIEEALSAVRQTPRSAASWGRLGMVLRAHAYGAEANICFAQAERQDPHEPRWPYLQGLTLLLTDLDAAIPKLQRAVELCGDNPPAPRLRLAEALLARGLFEESEQQFKRAYLRGSANPRVHLGLARVAWQRDDPKTCMVFLASAEARMPGRKDVRELQAAARLRLGQESPPEGNPRPKLQDDPLWPDPFVEEVEALRVGLQLRLDQAAALFDRGQVGQAVALMERTVARHPQSDEAWQALGKALIRLKQYPKAQHVLNKAVALRPNSVESLFQLGVATFLQGDPRTALDSFRRVVQLKPDHALAQFNIGICSKALGERQQAVEAFQAALRSKPDFEDARRALHELAPP